MLTLLLLKCCKAFRSRVYTGDANAGVGGVAGPIIKAAHMLTPPPRCL